MEGVLKEGIKAVLEDPAFKISETGPSANSLKLAERAYTWLTDNSETATKIESSIVSLLTSCVKAKRKSAKATREKIWSAYHRMRISKEYSTQWKAFSSSIGCKHSQIFCQYVGHHMFKQILKKLHPLPKVSAKETPFDPTYEELSGMRYAAGWVVRAVRKELTASSQPLKEDLLECLLVFEDSSMNADDTNDERLYDSREWINSVDRGGLVKVNDLVFDFFFEVEKILRKTVGTGPVTRLPPDLDKTIITDEAVQFVWHLISPDWTVECAKALLEMIIKQWIKIRGFSYADAWGEKLKTTERKTTQKTKGLRKQLQPIENKAKKETAKSSSEPAKKKAKKESAKSSSEPAKKKAKKESVKSSSEPAKKKSKKESAKSCTKQAEKKAKNTKRKSVKSSKQPVGKTAKNAKKKTDT